MIQVSAPSLMGNEEVYLLEVIRSSQLSQGRFVRRLEETFAEFCGTRFAVSCCNGTAALHLAMLALGVSPGKAVIVPALTYVATANAVSYCGGSVILCDVDPTSWNMSPIDLERAISIAREARLQPVGVIPVHLYGVPAEMSEIEAIAEKNGMWVVEDAAEAHGATYRGLRAGSLGKLGAFSLYGNKVITCGEGGLVTTDDSEMNRLLRLYRGQGVDSDRRYYHSVIGYNYRMTDLQAAVALAQLEMFATYAHMREKIAATYRELLAGHVVFQAVAPHCRSSNWMVTVLLPDYVDRAYVESRLTFAGIETRPVFVPLTELPPYKTYPLGHAQHVSMHGISLPTHVNLSREDIHYVARTLIGALVETEARR